METTVKPITRFVILLDKSGSMNKTKEKAIQGVNEQIQLAKSLTEEHDIRVTFITFNHDVYEHLFDAPVSELSEIDPDEYMPKDGTAMRDAMGYALTKLWETDSPDQAVLMKVISDGDTYDDKYYKGQRLVDLIAKWQETKRITITYMGCTDLKAFAEETKIPLSNMASWSNANNDFVEAATKNANSRDYGYFASRKLGVMSCSTYASDVEGVAADFTKSADVDTVKPVDAVSNPFDVTPDFSNLYSNVGLNAVNSLYQMPTFDPLPVHVTPTPFKVVKSKADNIKDDGHRVKSYMSNARKVEIK